MFKEEIEKDTVTKQSLLDDAIMLTDKWMAAEEVIKEKDEKIDDMMEKHKKKQEENLEKYEAQSTLDNDKIKLQEMEILKLEEMGKKLENSSIRE